MKLGFKYLSNRCQYLHSILYLYIICSYSRVLAVYTYINKEFYLYNIYYTYLIYFYTYIISILNTQDFCNTHKIYYFTDLI